MVSIKKICKGFQIYKFEGHLKKKKIGKTTFLRITLTKIIIFSPNMLHQCVIKLLTLGQKELSCKLINILKCPLIRIAPDPNCPALPYANRTENSHT